MNNDGDYASLDTEPASDVGAVWLACRRRILEREGIPMFLALQDVRPGHSLQIIEAAARAEGTRLATLFDHYEQAVADLPAEELPAEELPVGPDPVEQEKADEDPTGAGPLIDVLVVLSDQHLRAPTSEESGRELR